MADTVNDVLKEAVVEAGHYEEVNNILYDLIFGRTNAVLAAEELTRYAREAPNAEEVFLKVSNQILDLACDHAFLQPPLVRLVAAANGLPPAKCPDETLRMFRSSFGPSLHGMARSTYAGLLGGSLEQPSDESLIRYHVNLNGFTARLMVEEDPSRRKDSSSTFTRPDDALFIISSALETPFSDPETSPDVDIPAAARYMIHAAALFLDECESATADAQGAHRPQHDPRGRLWTGSPGFSRGRWELWKKQFCDVQAAPVLEDTKRIANIALRAMQAVES